MITKKLIQKYFEGKCTIEEESQVLKYFADEDPQLLFDLMLENWKQILPEEKVDNATTERMLEVIKQSTFGDDKHTPPIIQRRWMNWRNVAAIFLVFFCVASLLFLLNKRNKPDKTWIAVVNNNEVTRRFILPDSSSVWINPGSSISYQSFSNKERHVRVEGEAFFDVKHNTQKPFIVYTEGIATKVLGTAFNIEAYAKENTLKISLVRGSVSVAPYDSSGNIKSIITKLVPGQTITYTKQDQTYQKSQIQISNAAYWTNGSIVFDDVPIEDALQRVASRYSLHLSYKNGTDTLLSNKHLSAIFHGNDTLGIINNMVFTGDCIAKKSGININVYKMPR